MIDYKDVVSHREYLIERRKISGNFESVNLINSIKPGDRVTVKFNKENDRFFIKFGSTLFSVGNYYVNCWDIIEEVNPMPKYIFKIGDRVKITFKDCGYFWGKVVEWDVVYWTIVRESWGNWFAFNNISSLSDKTVKQSTTSHVADFEPCEEAEVDNTQCRPPLPKLTEAMVACWEYKAEWTFNLLWKNEMTTLAQEIFDRFLKSNKTKVIEAVESAEINMQTICNLVNPLNDLMEMISSSKKNLERAYERQDKNSIKTYLLALQTLNEIMEDKLFEQMVTIGNAIQKNVNKKLK